MWSIQRTIVMWTWTILWIVALCVSVLRFNEFSTPLKILVMVVLAVFTPSLPELIRRGVGTKEG